MNQLLRVTNLTRTLVLSLQAEGHGIASLDRVHDLIGNVMITTLIVLIWIGGKMLALDRSSPPTIAPEQIKDRAAHLIRNLGVSARSIVRPITGAFVIAIFSAHMLSTWLEKKDRTQTAPAFSVRQDSSNERRRIAPEIWNELRPTAGQAVRRRSAEFSITALIMHPPIHLRILSSRAATALIQVKRHRASSGAAAQEGRGSSS